MSPGNSIFSTLFAAWHKNADHHFILSIKSEVLLNRPHVWKKWCRPIFKFWNRKIEKRIIDIIGILCCRIVSVLVSPVLFNYFLRNATLRWGWPTVISFFFSARPLKTNITYSWPKVYVVPAEQQRNSLFWFVESNGTSMTVQSQKYKSAGFFISFIGKRNAICSFSDRNVTWPWTQRNKSLLSSLP